MSSRPFDASTSCMVSRVPSAVAVKWVVRRIKMNALGGVKKLRARNWYVGEYSPLYSFKAIIWSLGGLSCMGSELELGWGCPLSHTFARSIGTLLGLPYAAKQGKREWKREERLWWSKPVIIEIHCHKSSVYLLPSLDLVLQSAARHSPLRSMHLWFVCCLLHQCQLSLTDALMT